jgi:hypothetical protein
LFVTLFLQFVLCKANKSNSHLLQPTINYCGIKPLPLISLHWVLEDWHFSRRQYPIIYYIHRTLVSSENKNIPILKKKKKTQVHNRGIMKFWKKEEDTQHICCLHAKNLAMPVINIFTIVQRRVSMINPRVWVNYLCNST